MKEESRTITFTEEEYKIEKANRQKQFVICKNTYFRRKHY